MRTPSREQQKALRSLIREFLFLPYTSPWAKLFGGDDALPGMRPDRPARALSYVSDTGDQDTDPVKVQARDSNLDAVIVGDSQAGGPLGAQIETQLKGMGYKVSRTHADGASGAAVIDQLPGADMMPDLVVAIFGGNDATTGSAVAAANELYDKTRAAGSFLVIVGPPPATQITDVRSAGAAFGGVIGSNPSPDAWLTLDGGGYAARRIAVAEALEDAVEGRPGAAAYGIAARMSSPEYPDQPDGIHVRSGASEIGAKVLTGAGLDRITRALKASIDDMTGTPDVNLGDFDYMRWREEIAKIEGNYDSVNRDSNALGRYQFVPTIWWDDITAFARSQGKTLDTYKDFLDDHTLQDDFMYNYTVNNVLPAVKRLRKRNPDLTQALTDGKLAALVHFQGEGGGEKWLRSGVMIGADINAIDPGGYMRRVT